MLHSGHITRQLRLYLTVFLGLLFYLRNIDAGVTSNYVRPLRKSDDMPLDHPTFATPEGYNAPQQVHITQGDNEGKAVMVSWVTPLEPGSSEVFYGTTEHIYDHHAEGLVTNYTFYNQTSGFIHHCLIDDLEGETVPFKSFLHRYHVPFKASNSTSPLWYAIKRASAHIIVLSSYSPYAKYTPQWKWLKKAFKHVDRNTTPWLLVLMHSPFYNSNKHHYMEGESMRVVFEPWFVKYKVDLVFAGHVHAYERSFRFSNIAYKITNGDCSPIEDTSAPVYITIGDGGNIEGLAKPFIEPKPAYSAFREASFGHAMREIKNRTHAYYYWNRNQDGTSVAADSVWFYNQCWWNKSQMAQTSRMKKGCKRTSLLRHQRKPSIRLDIL